MWNERFLFVYSAFLAIAIWAVIELRRKESRAKRRSRRVAVWSASIAALAVTLLIGHLWYYLNDSWHELGWASLVPGLGSVFAVLMGAVVGSFTARFVWSLFGTDFGRKDPLIGAAALLILLVIYGLPAYQREVGALLGHVGTASVKTPMLELSFTQQSQFRNAVASARDAKGDEHSSAIPRPSYPNPALEKLKEAVSDEYFGKEDGYIAYLAGHSIPKPTALSDATLDATQKFLRPAQALAVCLQGYVKIFPDSQLLLVDIKPLLQWFFRVHAQARAALKNGAELDEPWQDAEDFRTAVAQVRENVLKALVPEDASGQIADGIPGKTLVNRRPRVGQVTDRNVSKNAAMSARAQGRFADLVDDSELRKQLEKFGYEKSEIEDFVQSCGERFDQTSNKASDHPPTISYLQPYVTIALAKLLVAHGSPDAAIHMLTQWLDLWRCAQGIDPRDGAAWGNGDSGKRAACTPVAKAKKLPDWFSIRAEFEINVLLYKVAGNSNIVYRDFLKDHGGHFAKVAQGAEADRGLSIPSELTRCLNSRGLRDKPNEPIAKIRAILLRSLLQNEDTFLRSEIHFLAEQKWPGMENLFERALALTSFRIECVHPENGSGRPFWEGTLADYSITAGLLGLAISEKLAITADSADQRARAEDIRTKAKSQLRYGQRKLCETNLKDDRKEINAAPWSERVFSVSGWEHSCSLAQRAIYQLDASSQ
jgi:hypothetical protein